MIEGEEGLDFGEKETIIKQQWDSSWEKFDLRKSLK